MCIDTELPTSSDLPSPDSKKNNKLKQISIHPDVKEAGRATVRTVINAGISIMDTIPVLGEIPSEGADVLKAIARGIRFGKFFIQHPAIRHVLFDKLHLSALDLTPDVSLKVAVLTELTEPVTATTFPSHIIETTFQLRHDLPRMVKGVKAAISILKDEQKDFSGSPEVEEAIKTFDVTPPDKGGKNG